MWDQQRFAHALANLVEYNDSAQASALLKILVVTTCRRLKMGDDALDVLQNTWVAILELARNHETYPSIARKVPRIAANQAINIIRHRERSRKLVDRLDHFIRASGTDLEPDAAAGLEPEHESIVSGLLERLREDHRAQYDAIILTLQSPTQEEARLKYQELRDAKITRENFRQLHSRATRRMRRYWEQSDD